MRILVVGADGLVGSNVVAGARDRGHTVVGTHHETRPALDVALCSLDVRDTARFRSLLCDHDPDAVVNCAAITDVDACEANPEAAAAVNAEAPGELAAACSERGCRFAHLSTDYVFGGTADAPYAESAEPDPRQRYGRSKLRGERAVREADDDAVIARLSFVYGTHGASGRLSGFPAWVRDSVAAGDPVALFTDQWVTPTRAGQAAETVLDLLATGSEGTVHVACRSCVTPYAFGDRITELVGKSPDGLERASMDGVERAAERPAYTCLAVDRVEALLGRPQPTLEEDLADVDAAVWST